MLCLILIVGGLLIMMGQHDRSEALFYYFRLEDQVPETHLLRLIDKHISFEFVRRQLKDSYSETGRPSNRSITPYMLTRDSIHRKRSPFSGPERFTYEPENNRYICPAGQFLNYGGRVYRNRAFNYIGTRKKCGPCSLRPQCTSAAFRGLIIH